MSSRSIKQCPFASFTILLQNITANPYNTTRISKINPMGVQSNFSPWHLGVVLKNALSRNLRGGSLSYIDRPLLVWNTAGIGVRCGRQRSKLTSKRGFAYGLFLLFNAISDLCIDNVSRKGFEFFV